MGLRGCGKSTAGRLLADRLGVVFVDLDDAAAALMNAADAAAAIAAHGMDRFRRAEVDSLETELTGDAGVIALGGGTPTAPGAAETLREAAANEQIVLVYLHTEPGELRGRLGKTDTSSRPSLTGRGTLDEIGEIYLRRDPLYRSLATRIIETTDLTAEQIADELAMS